MNIDRILLILQIDELQLANSCFKPASSNNLSSTIVLGVKAFHKVNLRLSPIVFGFLLPLLARSVTNIAAVDVNACAHKQPAASVGKMDNPNEPKTGLAEISNELPPLVMQIIVRRDLLNVRNTIRTSPARAVAKFVSYAAWLTSNFTGRRVGLWSTHGADCPRCHSRECSQFLCCSFVSLHQVLISSSQVLHETRDRDETIQYLADLRNMHKVSPPFWCRFHGAFCKSFDTCLTQ